MRLEAACGHIWASRERQRVEPGTWLHPECGRRFLNTSEGLLGVHHRGQSHCHRGCSTRKASLANISDPGADGAVPKSSHNRRIGTRVSPPNPPPVPLVPNTPLRSEAGHLPPFTTAFLGVQVRELFLETCGQNQTKRREEAPTSLLEEKQLWLDNGGHWLSTSVASGSIMALVQIVAPAT